MRRGKAYVEAQSCGRHGGGKKGPAVWCGWNEGCGMVGRLRMVNLEGLKRHAKDCDIDF